jgi:type I restriction enzyme S subunit
VSELVPLRRLVICLDGKRVPLNREERSIIQGDVPYWGAGGVVDHIDRALFDEALVLLGEDGAPFFDSARDVAFLVDGPVWVNNHIHVLRPRGVDARFLTYSLNVVDYARYISGSTRDKLTQDDMREIVIRVPSIGEQRRIADFLDIEVSRIDRLILQKERAVDLIDERDKALVEAAVLGRIEDGVDREDVGIPSIGRAPSRWKVLRNKYLFREVQDFSVNGEEELLTVSHLTGVTPRTEKEVSMFLAESLVGYKCCQPGDLVINTLWAWMGALGVTSHGGIVSPAYGVYRPNSEIVYGPYFDALYRTRAYVCEMTRYSKGVWTSRLRLYPEAFLSLRALVPPIDDQKKIVHFMEAETAGLRRLRSAFRASIKKLQERRYSLMAAAVTGQIDVTTARGAVA